MRTISYTTKPNSPAAKAVADLLARRKDQSKKAYATLKAQGVPMTEKFTVVSQYDRVVGFGHEDRKDLLVFIASNPKWKYKEGYAMPNHKTPEGRALKKVLATIPPDITHEDMDLAFTGSKDLGMMVSSGLGLYIPHCGLLANHSGKPKPLITIPASFVTKRKKTLVEGLVELSGTQAMKLEQAHEKA